MEPYTKLVRQTRDTFYSGRTQVIQWRREQLYALLRLLDEQAAPLCEALATDLRKHKAEAMLMEVTFVRNELVHILDHLDEWTSPQKVKKNLQTMMDGVEIKFEPYGVVLIMGAWNYPIQLTLGPLIGAIAAGNCVIIKPSEVAEATADLLAKIVPQYLDKDCIHVVTGGVPETTALLKERFDYILYTGNSMVAKIIYEAASKYLTPVTLELGGKSPVYVDESSDIKIAARRILWGRLVNCGQTCIAPDYVMCKRNLQDKLVSEFKDTLKEFYGDFPQKSDSYGRMVNDRHFQRVQNLMSSGKVAVGGQTDQKDRYIAPTVLIDVGPTEPAMKDEIFGPVLPIMPVEGVEEAISFINSREKPLAMYIFSKNKRVVDQILQRTSSGGVTVNDTLMHSSVDTLPFGGVGNSGMGCYHGKFSFEMFSHRRGCLIKKQSMEGVNRIRYPPYTETNLKRLSWIMKKSPGKKGLLSWLPLIMIGLLIGIALKVAM